MPQAPVVEPLPEAAAPAPAPVEAPVEAPADASMETPEAELPPEVIQIPAVQAVTAGVPPAVSMPLAGAEKRDEVKVIAQNKDALMQAGFGFYRSLSGDLGVMFNGLKMNPQDLVAADKAGKLTELAPDFDMVNHEVAKSGLNNPIFAAGKPVEGAPLPAVPPGASGVTAAQQQTPAGAPVAPPPASVLRKMATQRVLNQQPGAPTTGPAPGAGRLLNQVLKQAV